MMSFISMQNQNKKYPECGFEQLERHSRCSNSEDWAAAEGREIFSSPKTFFLKCLIAADSSNVDKALEMKFGSFARLTYDLESEDNRAKESVE